ncbi:MAG: TIGR04190 family B12-binding domain/radical SAM domain protein [Actinomycetota bacterium]
MKTDLILLHPPSVYDFREMLIVPRPIADLVPSGPFFEMYPIGFAFLGEYLERHGFRVRVVNLAARMLAEPRFDVPRYLAHLQPAAFGIDLHWLPHCQGALEVAGLCKETHPVTPVIMGGYSASIFHRELMDYPQVDYVVRGDSTEEPLLGLMRAIAAGRSPEDIPNLTFRDDAGAVVENPLDYVPGSLDHLGDPYCFMMRSAARHLDVRGVRAFRGWWSYPTTAVLTVRGCSRDCAFCGGSASAMESCLNRKAPAYRSPEAIAADVRSISRFTGAPIFIIGDLRENGEDYGAEVLNRLGRIRPSNHVVLELFGPANGWYFDRVAASLPSWDLEISPQSHDEGIRRALGSGYTNAELEETIECALAAGCGRLDVFFMIGLQGQTPESVDASVEYCGALMKRFGKRLNPLIGPLAPFIDPGCLDEVEAHSRGYRILLHSLEDYRRALLEPHWRDMLGYETRWMTPERIVESTYRALFALNRLKGRLGHLDRDYMLAYERLLLESQDLLERVDAMAAMEPGLVRDMEFAMCRAEAGRLLEEGALVKEQISWPVTGRGVRPLGVLRSLLGGGRR